MGGSGGCQCGAVRYRFADLGRASICHCRMCQKAFGSFFAPLVTAIGLEWTKGSRQRFQSSNRNWRGFCADCGTPLTYEAEGVMEISIGSLDDPEQAAPVIQVNADGQCSFFKGLADLPLEGDTDRARNQAWNAGVISYQHPDRD